MTYLYAKHKSDFYFVSHSDRQLPKSQSCHLDSKCLNFQVHRQWIINIDRKYNYLPFYKSNIFLPVTVHTYQYHESLDGIRDSHITDFWTYFDFI